MFSEGCIEARIIAALERKKLPEPVYDAPEQHTRRELTRVRVAERGVGVAPHQSDAGIVMQSGLNLHVACRDFDDKVRPGLRESSVKDSRPPFAPRTPWAQLSCRNRCAIEAC